jgi:hypothetical protein
MWPLSFKISFILQCGLPIKLSSIPLKILSHRAIDPRTLANEVLKTSWGA